MKMIALLVVVGLIMGVLMPSLMNGSGGALDADAMADTQTVYRWQDEAGEWQYGEVVPEGVTAERVGSVGGPESYIGKANAAAAKVDARAAMASEVLKAGQP